MVQMSERLSRAAVKGIPVRGVDVLPPFGCGTTAGRATRNECRLDIGRETRWYNATGHRAGLIHSQPFPVFRTGSAARLLPA